MSDPMPPCPYARPKDHGGHSLSYIVPGDDDHDLLLVCERCGAVKREAVATPAPVDDLPADVLRILAAREG